MTRLATISLAMSFPNHIYLLTHHCSHTLQDSRENWYVEHVHLCSGYNIVIVFYRMLDFSGNTRRVCTDVRTKHCPDGAQRLSEVSERQITLGLFPMITITRHLNIVIIQVWPSHLHCPKTTFFLSVFFFYRYPFFFFISLRPDRAYKIYRSIQLLTSQYASSLLRVVLQKGMETGRKK